MAGNAWKALVKPSNPSRDLLVTPDAVVLDLETVGVGTRSIALLIDVALILVGLFVLSFVAGTLTSSGGGGISTAAAIVVLLSLPIAYPLVLEATWGGRTVGKAAMGLRVVTRVGGRIGWRHAAMRAVIGLFEIWMTAGGVAFVSAMVTERSQRLGDLAAGTLVVRARTGHAPAKPLQVQPDQRLDTLAGTVSTGRLTPDEYGVVRGLVERFGELDPQRRRELSLRLATQLVPRIGAPPAGTAPEDWLVAAVVAHQQAQQPPPGGLPTPPPPPAPVDDGEPIDGPAPPG